MIEELLWITNRFGEKLEAVLRKPIRQAQGKPEGKGPFPAVILVSGFGMDLHEYINSNDEISKRLVGAGFLTVQFNFSVVGTSRELSLDDRAKELSSVWELMQRRTDIDRKRMGIHATSFGTLTTMQAKLYHVASMVFVSGVYDRAQTFKQEFIGRGATIHLDTDTELPRSSGIKTVVGASFWPSLDRFDPFAIARKFHTPILLIHGDKDEKIQTSFVKTFYAAIASKRKKLKIFRGGDHGITDVSRAMREEFLALITVWFRRTL